MKQPQPLSRSLFVGATLLAAPVASHALDIQAGDWKFSLNGNVNVVDNRNKRRAQGKFGQAGGKLVCCRANQ